MSAPACPTLNIVGGGRVGRTLGQLWHHSGLLHIQDICCRSLASARTAQEFIGAGQAVAQLPDMRDSDYWLLAVPDQQIAAVATQLAELQRPSALAFHCSGFFGSALLLPLRSQGWATASAHPVLSFADPAHATQQLAGSVCALEGDGQALAQLDPLLSALGTHCFVLQAEHKPLYHAAAVFATNFLPVLQAVSQDLWQHSGVPQALIEPMSRQLLQHCVHNVLALGPRRALTGPAARGDMAVVQAQQQAVHHWSPQAGLAYQALSQLAAALANQTGGGECCDTGVTSASPTPTPAP